MPVTIAMIIKIRLAILFKGGNIRDTSIGAHKDKTQKGCEL